MERRVQDEEALTRPQSRVPCLRLRGDLATQLYRIEYAWHRAALGALILIDFTNARSIRKSNAGVVQNRAHLTVSDRQSRSSPGYKLFTSLRLSTAQMLPSRLQGTTSDCVPPHLLAHG